MDKESGKVCERERFSVTERKKDRSQRHFRKSLLQTQARTNQGVMAPVNHQVSLFISFVSEGHSCRTATCRNEVWVHLVHAVGCTIIRKHGPGSGLDRPLHRSPLAPSRETQRRLQSTTTTKKKKGRKNIKDHMVSIPCRLRMRVTLNWHRCR